MTDETIRTKAITYTRDHLKEIAAYAVAVASTVVTVSMAYGHKQANTEMLSGKLDEVITEQRAQRQETQKVREDVASLKTAVEDVKSNQDDFKNWKDRVTGVAETVTVPKLQGHRARHP